MYLAHVVYIRFNILLTNILIWNMENIAENPVSGRGTLNESEVRSFAHILPAGMQGCGIVSIRC